MRIKIYLILVLIVSSCVSDKTFINKQLKSYEINDSTLLNAITLYKKEVILKQTNTVKERSLIIILSKDIKSSKAPKYIGHIYNDSNLYSDPISGYFVHNNDTILIYSRRDRFMNPWNYSADFSSQMKQSLKDTESLYSNDSSKNFNRKMVFKINHDPFWLLDNQKIFKNVRNKNPYKIIYGYQNKDGYDFNGKGDSLSIKISQFN